MLRVVDASRGGRLPTGTLGCEVPASKAANVNPDAFVRVPREVWADAKANGFLSGPSSRRVVRQTSDGVLGDRSAVWSRGARIEGSERKPGRVC